MAENRQYDKEYKVQAVRLAKDIGQAKAAKELGIPKNTLYGWVRANRLGTLDLGVGSHTPESAMTLNEELVRLWQQAKELDKENRHLKKENDFLEEASAFFAASRPKRKQNGITKVDREVRKSDDLLKRDFQAAKPLTKCVTDMTEIKASNGKLYVSAIFGSFDLSVIGLAIDTNQKAPLCVQTLENACKAYPALRGAVIHSDRGTQYTSHIYRAAISQYGIQQSMNSEGGRCHDNARCESMWGRMKSELLYERYPTEKMTTDEVKVVIWRYYISYWNNRRICSANGGLPPMVKRRQCYDSLKKTA